MHLTALARELQQGLQGKVKINEPLARFTTWQLGGPADLFYQPRDKEELISCLNFARQKGLPLHVLGNGSNILVLDGGVRGLVLRTREWRQVKVQDQGLRAAAGALISELLRIALRYGLSGLEFAAGIPATIGGAVVTNAGTPSGSLGDVVRGVEIISPAGDWYYLERKDITFGYRCSSLGQEGTVIAVDLKLTAAGVESIREKIKTNLQHRRDRQPLNWPNAGSVFKNPPGFFAGQLIESIGAKGWRVGQAEVSTKHANFIINRGQATAKDVLELVTKIQEAVANQTGINLELEVEIWGEGL